MPGKSVRVNQDNSFDENVCAPFKLPTLKGGELLPSKGWQISDWRDMLVGQIEALVFSEPTVTPRA